MASTVRKSPIAFVSEVARYLAFEPAQINNLIKVAKLPALKIPQETRTVYRIPLRDFHAWLLARAQNPAPHLSKYETFLADFDETARTKAA